MPVCDAPCPPPFPPAISQLPSSPTHPATIQPGSVPLASGVDTAAAVAEAAFALKAPDVAEANAAAVRHTAYAAAVAIDGMRGGADQRRFPAGVARVRRRRLQPDRLPLAPRAQLRTLTLGVRLDVIEARERGLSFPDILRTIAPSSFIDNLCKVWQRRNHCKSLAAAGTRASRANGLGSDFGSIDARMTIGFFYCQGVGVNVFLSPSRCCKRKPGGWRTSCGSPISRRCGAGCSGGHSGTT